MAALKPKWQERKAAFSRLLIHISQRLDENEAAQLQYLGELSDGGTRKGSFEVLVALERCGMFSPSNTEPLIKLLQEIKRHDLAEHVRQSYQEIYPDTGKLEHSGRGWAAYRSILVL